MQLIYTFLSFIFASSLICASPIDRFFDAKRQVNEEVVVVTVTSAVTITVSSTMAQVTTTVTVNAALARPVVAGTTTTDATEPTTTTTPVPEVTTSTTPAAAPAPSPATPDPATNDATSSDSIGTIFSGQGTFYETGYMIPLASVHKTNDFLDLEVVVSQVTTRTPFARSVTHYMILFLMEAIQTILLFAVERSRRLAVHHHILRG